MPRLRRKTQRGRGPGMSRPAGLPRVFVACHTPSRHGKVTWEGHTIVGYVDVEDGSAVKGDAPYYRGWDSIPASLKGTVDIVLSMYCPSAPALMREPFQWDTPVATTAYGVQETHEILTKSVPLLRPGGTILFPHIPSVRPETQAILRENGLSVESVEVPRPRWIRHRQEDRYDVNEDASRETLHAIQMTRIAGGRRRRYPLSSRRRSIRS